MAGPCFSRSSPNIITPLPLLTQPKTTVMNPLKILVITATLIITCNHLFAQKDDLAGTEKQWLIKDAFPVSETLSLALYEHKKDENGIVLVNNKGDIQWELPFEGCVMAFSKYKDNFLVFYAKKGHWDKMFGSRRTIKQINAATIDIKSKKIIDDKVIYTGSNYVVPDFQLDPAGNFSQLLLRKSGRSSIPETGGFILLTFNADGSVSNKELTSIATGGKFIACSGGKDGSVFISSIQNWSSVVVEKFSHEGTLISKLESPVAIRQDPDYTSVMRTDPGTNNAVILSFKAVNKDKDYAFTLFKFNFDDNKVIAINEAPLTKKSSPYNFSRYMDLKPMDIFFTNDKIIVVRGPWNYEMSTWNNRTTVTYNSGNIVVSVYDKQMKLQRETILSRGVSSYSFNDIFINCHLEKDRLFILSSENAGMGKFGSFCYNVNFNEGTYERKQIGQKASMSTSISAPSTIWLKNELIMTNLHIGFGSGPGRYSSVLERVGFDAL